KAGVDIGCYNGNCPLNEFMPHEFEESILEDSGISIMRFQKANQLTLPLTFFMGSFYYQVKALKIDGERRIGFRIDNDTSLESGTHIPGRFGPAYYLSVEDLINGPNQYGITRDTPLATVFERAPVISILRNRSRSQLQGTGGGATLYQTYMWTERYDPCIPQWTYAHIRALGTLFLNIRPWNGEGTINPYGSQH
ncbi:MAG TPA: hypothetical protein VK249_15280, partial [Anaerolineales bacterium]|nr:hypothetical protein [Anaerolineales bacterium]